MLAPGGTGPEQFVLDDALLQHDAALLSRGRDAIHQHALSNLRADDVEGVLGRIPYRLAPTMAPSVR